MNRNIDTLIDYIVRVVDEHKLGLGKYARWTIPDKNGERNMGATEYGCADAANILYTVGRFPRDLDERAAFVKTLQGFQHPDGRFAEATHHTLHSTAHCIAALELFDAAPIYPLTYHMENFGTIEKMEALLESIAWASNPWRDSHRGAGFFAAMMLTCNMSLEWQDAYFHWLAERADPVTGIGLANCHDGQQNFLHHFGGWFHYMFNHVYCKRPFPYPERMVDSCMAFYQRTMSDFDNAPARFANQIGFEEIDWVLLLNRASMQAGYRREEVKDLLRVFSNEFLDYLESDLENQYKTRFDDLHAFFGTVCCLSELQLALPGEIKTTIPLKNVLDRRPFI